MGLVPARNAPTRIGSGQSTNCGSTSATASRRRPANAILTRKLLAKNKRPLTANASSMSMPPTNARRLPARRLHIVSAFSRRRLLVALWPNALLLRDRWRQLQPSSCGFAAAASTSSLPARLCRDSNARPLLHICDTSRTAACTRRLRRSSADGQLQCKQRLWPTRLMSGAGKTCWPWSNAAESWPNALRQRRRKRWPWSNAAKSWPNTLRRRCRKRWPRSNAAKSWPNALRRQRRKHWPPNIVAKNWPNALWRWRIPCWPQSNVTTSGPSALRRWQ